MGLLVLNKPWGVLCQFSGGDGRRTLADFIDHPGYYPAGRLDLDSEGLLLLTDDGALQARITDPRHQLLKRYLVQVEGIPSARALDNLRRGVRLKDGPTRPAEARVLAKRPAFLWAREQPIRQRRRKPTHWLEIGLREGRNRQVRRMTAAVGLPTLRLVRIAIGTLDLSDPSTALAPGQWRVVDPADLFPAD